MVFIKTVTMVLESVRSASLANRMNKKRKA